MPTTFPNLKAVMDYNLYLEVLRKLGTTVGALEALLICQEGLTQHQAEFLDRLGGEIKGLLDRLHDEVHHEA